VITGYMPHHQVLAKLAKHSETYLEIGVQDGDSIAAVVEANPALHLTMCDDWGLNHGGTNRGNHDHIDRLLNDMGHFGVNRVFLDGKSQDLIPGLVEQFDLVHVDADHSFEGCKADLKNCWPLTRCWLVVHDVFFQEVRDAVFQFLEWNAPEIAEIKVSASDHGTIVIERRAR